MTKKIDKRELDLQQREKAELVAIIQLMLRQQPELEWCLHTAMPVAGKHTEPTNGSLYRRQIETAVSAAAEHYRDRNYREALRNTLSALQTTADEFANNEDYIAALPIYEVLVAEAIKHFSTIETGYLIFPPILVSCIDGLDTCFAGAEENQEMRQRVLQALFSIYTFSVGSYMDLGEDIPDLLTGNATIEERQMIAGWVRDVLTTLTSKPGSADDRDRTYRLLLRSLERKGLA